MCERAAPLRRRRPIGLVRGIERGGHLRRIVTGHGISWSSCICMLASCPTIDWRGAAGVWRGRNFILGYARIV